MKWNKTLIAISISVLSGLMGCEPKPDSAELLDQFVVQTNNDKTVKFSDYNTYTIQLDTIIIYTNGPGLVASKEYIAGVNKEIKAKMDNRGFTQVDKNEDPDLGINVFINYNYSQYQSNPNVGGYGSGYYGYGGYYGWYQPTYVEEVNRGTLNIEIIDLKNRQNNKVKVVWYSIMGDLFNAIDVYKQSIDAIDQSFEQSLYIQG